MESLARLVLIILASIYFSSLILEIIGVFFLIRNFFPEFGGWWYFLWVPIIAVANGFLSVLILNLIARINN